MKRFLTKQINEYKRELENRKLRAKLFGMIIFIVITFYGILGCGPFVNVLQRKAQTIKELENLNSQLERKKGILQNLELDLPSYQESLSQLEVAVPQDTDLEEYLVILVNTAASSGYTHKAFIVTKVGEGEAVINVKLEGTKFFLYSLLAAIEDLDRLSEIQSVSYSFSEDTASVNLVIRIFYHRL